MNRIGLVCVLTAVVLVPNVFAADRCTLDKWGGARPPAKSYGPDDNEYINPTHALKLTIPRGRTAHFEFSTHGPESEPAMMIYSLNFAEQLAERVTGPKTVIITAWHKDGGGAWAGDYIRKESSTLGRNTWLAAGEDGGGNDYRDIVATISCR